MPLTPSLSDPAWLELIAADPAATPFHHPAWAATLAHAYGFDAHGLVLDAPGGGRAALPVVDRGRRRISLPFTDSCAPLGLAEPGGLGEGIEALRLAAGLSSIEIRAAVPGGTGHVVASGHRHELGLEPDFDTVAAGFHKSKVRRKLRRADREGVEVRRGETTRDLLETFYPLHVTTRRRLGVPVQPRRFFAVLGERMIEQGLGFTLTASLGDEPLSSAVFLVWNRRLIYKFSASGRSGRDVGAGQAVIGEAIRWGCESGCRSLDFGRTAHGSEGLRAFKLSWGATEHDLTYTVFADDPPRAGTGRTHELLAGVLRRSPELLTRAVGRAAYRYTA